LLPEKPIVSLLSVEAKRGKLQENQSEGDR
jgi:hypothetical protein